MIQITVATAKNVSDYSLRQDSPFSLAVERVIERIKGFYTKDASEIVTIVVKTCVDDNTIESYARMQPGGFVMVNEIVANIVYRVLEKYNEKAEAKIQIPKSSELTALVSLAYAAKPTSSCECVVL